MKTILSTLTREFATALLVALGFVVFLVWDQLHWWQAKPDYAFGYIVPLFVGWVLYERWPRLKELLAARPAVRAPVWMQRIVELKAAVGLLFGLAFFGLGAFYRAGAGASQPGSLAMALGFAAMLLSLVYLSAPSARAKDHGLPVAQGWWASVHAVLDEPRYRIACLFVFPALVWVVSAPLVSAVENTLSLFLLKKVTVVVFFVFDMLGLPLERQGNVLVLPKGEVGVAEACSGIRSLTGSIFAGSFLAAVFLDRLWKKAGLVGSAMLLAFFTNILRSLFLTSWAYAYGSHAIEGSVHDITGYAVLGVTVIGLLALIPLFNFRLDESVVEELVEENGANAPRADSS